MEAERTLALTTHRQPVSGSSVTGMASKTAARIEIARSAAAAGQHLRAWQELAERAAEPNVFYEPWQFLTALETVCEPLSLCLLYVYRGDRLIGFFPFSRHASYKGLPVRRYALVDHIHCFLNTPLVATEADGELCCAEVARWMAARRGPTLFEFRRISADFARLLTRHLQRASVAVAVLARHERAYFNLEQSSGRSFDGGPSNKALKELRRQQRRLAECGDLEYRELAPGEDPAPWIEAFLALEQGGWKGRERTALGCSDDERHYFRSIAREAHALGRLDLAGMFIDRRAIALSCKFRAAGGSFAFKIAFDERYARHSPGMLLELRCVDRARAEGSPRWIDSCAQPDHFMANRLWLDRREIVTLTATPGLYGRLVQRTAVRVKRIVSALRRRGR